MKSFSYKLKKFYWIILVALLIVFALIALPSEMPVGQFTGEYCRLDECVKITDFIFKKDEVCPNLYDYKKPVPDYSFGSRDLGPLFYSAETYIIEKCINVQFYE